MLQEQYIGLNFDILWRYAEVSWTHRSQRAAGTGPSETAGPAGVKVYWRESKKEKWDSLWAATGCIQMNRMEKCRWVGGVTDVWGQVQWRANSDTKWRKTKNLFHPVVLKQSDSPRSLWFCIEWP